MKKLITLFIALTLSISSITSAQAISDYILEYNGITEEYTGSIYKLMINGEFVETTVPPIIFNDYALVPIREVCEPMGALVNYITVSKQIFVNFEDCYLRLKIGSNTASVDEVDVEIPGGIAPMLISINGSSAKTMVPVRFMAEKLGFDVQFDGENGIIKINEPVEVKKSVINNFKTSNTNSSATIKLMLDKAVAEHTKPAITANDVLYFDISDCSYNLPSTNELNIGAIKSLRFGIHDHSTRVALDLSNYTGYKVTLSNDKKVFTITVNSRPIENEDTSNKEDNEVNLSGKIVVLDAGHGGRDPGTQGTLDGDTHYEKTVNLSITQKVKDILEENGVSVLMTRDSDTYPTLTERSDLANINDAVLFVSIHSNWATSETASGYEVYYSSLNNNSTTGLKSEELAKSILKSLSENVSTRNRGSKTADHVVTKTSYMPAVLIEVGFMSNSEELKLMIAEEFQADFAKGVAEGILAVLDKAQIPSDCGIIYEEMKALEEAKKALEETENSQNNEENTNENNTVEEGH